MARPYARSLCALVAYAALAACGRGAGPDAATPTANRPAGLAPAGGDGGSSGGAQVAPPSAIERHREAVRAKLQGAPAPLGAERALDAPLVTLSVTIAEDARTWSGSVAVEVVNATSGMVSELVFVLAPNLAPGDDGARVLTVGSVAVDGRAAEPSGGPSLLRVPVALAPGAGARVDLTFAGQIATREPVAFGLGAADLAVAADLAAVDPTDHATVGQRDGLLLLARAYPQIAPLGPTLLPDATAEDIGWLPLAHHALAVTAPDGLVVVGSGRALGSERLPDGRRVTRFEALATREVALVASRAFETIHEQVGAVDLAIVSRPGPAAADLRTHARRALEQAELRLGPFPRAELTVAEAPLARGAAAAYPGLVLVSDLFSAPAPPVAGEAPLLAVLTRHPARREGLAFAVHHAVAHQWWGQHVAVDARRARWLPEALASVSALAGLADAGAEKAARHQRALVLALPYQLARLAGAADAPVRGAVPGQGQARAAPEAVRSGKAALGLEAIRRAMSDTLYDATLRDLLREHGLGLLDEAVALERLAAAAPRPEVVRDLARRWLDEEHGDEDIGGLRPDLLLEYFVGDAAVDGGARELLGLLAGNAQLRGVIDAALGQGGGAPTLDGARLVGTLAALLGDEAPPELRRWLDLLAPLSGGGPPSRWGPEVLSGLAGQLGLDADGQAALQGAAALVFQLLEVPAEAPVAPGPPPE